MAHLFTSMRLRDLTLRNRIALAPMCTYSAGDDGRANDWHLVHYGARAIGGCGLILTEATAVEPRGRISVNDLGLWSDDQIESLSRVVRLCHEFGAKVGVQLAHAGRKAFTPSKGVGPQTGVAPSAIPFAEDWKTPEEMSTEAIEKLIVGWREAARRALAAGCDTIELHHAHGYLLHQFFSPISNHRRDEYGGAFEDRARLTLRVVRAIREVWPATHPLLLRVSASDWVEGGVVPADIVRLAPLLIDAGIDAIDCSSGGIIAAPPPPSMVGPGYQVPFASEIRREGRIPTMAVGLITDPQQAEAIVSDGHADMVVLGREMLRDPQWPLRAAGALGVDIEWPTPYVRGKPQA
jgi:2,4-dienoyl-CoA reductase-like NADH-dependent reductase (Old Yellow Enzyme family)